MSYIPESSTGTSIDRKYYYDVLVTLYPDYVANMIKNVYIKWAESYSKPEGENIHKNSFAEGIRQPSFVSSKSNLVFIINRNNNWK